MKATPERMKHIRMALAEAGYPEDVVTEWDGEMVYLRGSVPDEVIYRAAQIIAPEAVLACFDCWTTHSKDHDRQHACAHGDCQTSEAAS